MNTDKTLVYLERSEPSPIHLWINREDDTSPHDPFFQVMPHAIGRLKSLTIWGTPKCLQDITAHLSHPAPLLEELSIGAIFQRPVLTPTLFNGDLSSLRKLRLDFVHTELPWRGLVNLTSFTLVEIPSLSVRQLLDFLESTPHILQVEFRFVTLAPGAQTGRLVSLARLEGMTIVGGGPPSGLLNHLLIPVGARLMMGSTSIEDLLPRSLDNLRNFSDFTAIKLNFEELYPHMEFSGPNGKVTMVPTTHSTLEVNTTLESLARFDTSKAERLAILSGTLRSRDPLSQTLLSMGGLRTLALYQCYDLRFFFHTLDPSMDSSEQVVVCPRLEELVLRLHNSLPREMDFDIQSLMGMTAARALRGAKLKSVRIIDRRAERKLDPGDLVELRKWVWNVEYGPDWAHPDDGDEE